MTPYVLSTVTEPSQRLFLPVNSLPFLFLFLSVGFLFGGFIGSLMALALAYAVMLPLFSKDPYLLEVLRCNQKYKVTKRQLPEGGNLYGA